VHTLEKQEWEKSMGTCPWWPEVARGCIVAESTSPVGRGTAGLLLMKGMLSPLPLYGTNGSVIGELVSGVGAGPGEEPWWGRNGHGNEGEDCISPPEEGPGVVGIGEEASGAEAEAFVGVTLMASFWESWQALSESLEKVK